MEASTKRLLGLSYLALFALAFGLFFAWQAGTLFYYTALPVTPVSEIGRFPAGKIVRLEGRAHSEPPLLMADGSALAMQGIQSFHRYKGSRESIDYSEKLPVYFLLSDETARRTGDGLKVITQRFNPGLSSLPVDYSLDCTRHDLQKRIETLISPAFKDFYYICSTGAHLTISSVPQDSVVTVCGVLEATNSGGLQLGARCVDTLTGRDFVRRAKTESGYKGLAAAIFLGFVLLVLSLDGFFFYRYRRFGY